MNNKMWNDYFGNIENKYDLKINKHAPIVIFIDGKDITKSLKYNLISETKNSFNDIFEQTVKHFSRELDCIAISGVDEVSFIFEDSKKIQEIVPQRRYKAHEIVSIFSQHFYKYFNDRYTNGPVYWHCKCSNIPKGKIKSYIKYRSLTILELTLTYFLKREQVKNAGKISLSEKIKKCNEIAAYQDIENFEKGRIYISGRQVDLTSFFNNQIINVPETKREDEVKFLDINDF